ncbi:PBS lyase [Plantactinospora sp. S1510]|uniref:PBS lyase n=1 Tax=Plantactinospora alkalitolerans TaxID=2789879 RepID=A0ABS0H5V5_9ACTN|nr:PBS lyase [Plantactinospora alkalitolerans]MBF9133849.1 PBS lyase [Plantactinospora alkalitolerans]
MHRSDLHRSGCNGDRICGGGTGATLFAGLDEIDWASMNHAYGPAVEVPELLRGLVSDDPAIRETALDGMDGAVHHQGDVYECTLACIPYLFEAATRPGGPDRGPIVTLLASIGCAEVDDLAELTRSLEADADKADADADEEDWAANYRRAQSAVAAGYPVFLRLLTDPDPEVRRAVPEALLVCRAEASRVLDTLRRRLPVEPDPEARTALVETVGTLVRRVAAGHLTTVDEPELRAATEWLVGLVGGSADSGAGGRAEPSVGGDHVDPALRLTALTAVSSGMPAMLPTDLVPRALALLGAAYQPDGPVSEPAGFHTDTLRGAVRELREADVAGRHSPRLGPVVGDLSRALGDRVPDRIQLLDTLLRASDWECRLDAVRAAGNLVGGWRGDYRELVAAIGRQLLDPNPRLSRAASRVLVHLGELNRPVVDVLAENVAGAAPEESHRHGAGPPAWITVWPSHAPTIGDTLNALARLGDPRAVPPLRWALARDDPPKDVGAAVSSLGPTAVALLPLIRHQLRTLSETAADLATRRQDLARAVCSFGAAGAAALPELLPLATHEYMIRPIGRLGPAARDAVPVLRPLLDAPERRLALAAVSALYRITGDPAPVLPVLGRFLDATGYDATAAADEIAEIGPAAAGHLPRLGALLAEPDPHGWLHLSAARALWRVAGDADAVLPVLTGLWDRNPYTRTAVATIWAEIGQPAGAALPLLRAEQARPRRHTARDNGWSDSQVTEDEELLRVMAGTVDALQPAGG